MVWLVCAAMSSVARPRIMASGMTPRKLNTNTSVWDQPRTPAATPSGTNTSSTFIGELYPSSASTIPACRSWSCRSTLRSTAAPYAPSAESLTALSRRRIELDGVSASGWWSTAPSRVLRQVVDGTRLGTAWVDRRRARPLLPAMLSMEPYEMSLFCAPSHRVEHRGGGCAREGHPQQQRVGKETKPAAA